ncbi:Cadmium-translocating P-type ATPase [Pseudomonas savastanoi pv. glycinea]|nr:Cadmium-translocating P-type ATPase [Pseudomonas savastanoi pv. glycinea]
MSGEAVHTHHAIKPQADGSLLSNAEQRSAARQLTLAMLALGLLALGLVWRFFAPEQAGVSQLLLGAASLLVAIPVISAGWHSLRHPSLHGITDQLIALAMLGAWATGDLMTAALLPIIMIFGHVLEERSVIGSQEAIEALGRLTRSQARLLGPDGNIREVDNATLKAGDQAEVRAGDRVPADGRVLSGQASLDTSSITGESVPLEASIGIEVFGGAINLDGLLRIEVTRIGDESTLGKVIALMQSAERSKPPITRLLERYAGSYMVLVLLIAALTWFITQDAQAMLAVLVAACPCALVLSAPATAIAGIAVAARHGILIRSSAFLEELADLNSLVVDKTGTLTYGRRCRLKGRSIRNCSNWRPAWGRPAVTRSAVHWPGLWITLGCCRCWTPVSGRDWVWWRPPGRVRQRWAVRNCSSSWALSPPAYLHMTARWPGCRWMAFSWPGCCWPTASSLKRRLRCLNYVSWAWDGSCC